MSEVAVGYVSIVPKFGSGFKNAISSELGGAGTSVGKATGGSFRSTFLGVLAGNVMTSALSKIGGVIKGAVGGGFDRLMNIEQAQIKLKTLGIDVEKAMASVNDSVDGTKFAISDAADMAAFLGASGIKAGSEMTKWLSRTADAAQFMNRDFADVQQIIGKVVAEGRVTGETFQQLPLAAAALAEHLGISQAEVRKLASQGKISAEEFGEAMDKKIGGAAKNAGASFLSMAANLKTALNATMAKVLEPFTKAAMPIMAAMLPLVKQFRDGVAGPIGEALSARLQPAAEALAAKLQALPEIFASIGEGVQIFTDALTGNSELNEFDGKLQTINNAGIGLYETFRAVGPAIAGFAGGIQVFLDALTGNSELNEFDGHLKSINNIGVALSDTFRAVGEAVGPALGRIGEEIGPILESFGPGLLDALAPLGDVVVELAEAFGEVAPELSPLMVAMQALEPILPTVVDAVASMATALAELLSESLEAVLPVLVQLGELVAEEIVPALSTLVETALPPLSDLFGTVADTVGDLVEQLMPLVSTLLDSLIPVIGDLVEALGPVIESLAESLGPVIEKAGELLGEIAEQVTAVLIPAIDALLPVVVSVVEGIGPIIEGLGEVIGGVIDTIVALFEGDWQGAWDSFTGVVDSAMALFDTYIEETFRIGADLIGGLVEGIASMLGVPAEKAKEVADKVVSAVKGFFGIASPSKVMREVGTNVVQGLVDGIKNMITNAVSAGTELVSKIGAKLGEIKTKATEAFNRAVDAAKTGMSKMVDRVSEGADKVLGFFRDLPGKVVSRLGNLGSKLYGAGKDLVQGLINGIGNMAGAVTQKISGVVNGAISGAKRLLGIASPSRVFMEIGRFTGEGLAIGMGETIGVVNKASDKLASAATIDIPSVKLGTGLDGQSKLSAERYANAMAAAVRSALDGMRIEWDRDGSPFIQMSSVADTRRMALQTARSGRTRS